MINEYYLFFTTGSIDICLYWYLYWYWCPCKCI